VIGLLAAGAQPGEAVMRALAAHLASGSTPTGAGATNAEPESNAFATGQTLHALRRSGFSDDDPTVARGTRWLMAHQGEDGGWSHEGRGKAEAMWAVFGLVSIDVLSALAEGLRDGEHAAGPRVAARRRGGQPAATRCSSSTCGSTTFPSPAGAARRWRTRSTWGLARGGAHVLDLVATNARGQSSRRRVSFYTGAHYLVNATAAWEQGVTRITLRDVAPTEVAGRVSAEVCAAAGGAQNPLWRNEITSAQGPLEFRWDGHDSAQRALPAGRYVATLRFVDASGRAVQSVEVPFVHDTPEAQQARFAEVGATSREHEARRAPPTPSSSSWTSAGNVVAADRRPPSRATTASATSTRATTACARVVAGSAR
jgi:hypothetical protein